MKTFKLYMEQSGSSIGLFPGAFKPPHKGHFETVKKAAAENDVVVVLVSAIDRDNISAAESFNVWNIYKPYLPKNVVINVVSGSPVLVIYQVVDILNNGAYTATPKSSAPRPEAQEIAQYLQGYNRPYHVNLYASDEDVKGRYAAFSNNNNEQIYRGKSVSSINAREVSRVASATNARAALARKDFDTFKTLLPSITKEDMGKIYRMLAK
jgi:cytidyltransferase-like protein